METKAKNYGIKIEYQYLGHYRYCFDYTNNEPKNIDLKTPCPLNNLSEPLGNRCLHESHYNETASNLFLYKKTRPENDSKRVLARNERLELPTPGFGDQCSTN